MTQNEKKWIWLIPIASIIICSILLIYFFFNLSIETCPGGGQGRNMNLIYSILILIIIILTIIFPVTYYYISHSLKNEMEKNLQIIKQITNKTQEEKPPECPPITKSCKTFVLKFLDYNENRIIKKLIEHDGVILQSEISRMPNMGKVKAHRILKDMEIKGIITIDQYGKTNKIGFSEEAKEVFFK